MSPQRRLSWRWVLPATVLAALVYLNASKLERRSIAFEDHHFASAFATSRGWPFRAYAPANDEGAELVDASVVQGNTRVYRDLLEGPYPHLAVNPVFVALDVLAAGALLLGAFAVTWWSPRKPPANARR